MLCWKFSRGVQSSEMQWWWDNFIFLYSHEMDNKEVCSSLKIIVYIPPSFFPTKWTFSDKIYVWEQWVWLFFIFLYVLEYCSRNRTPAAQPVWSSESRPRPSILWNKLVQLLPWVHEIEWKICQIGVHLRLRTFMT